MAVEAETRQDIIELVVTALDAAPGTSMLNKLIEIYNEQGTLAAVAEAIVTSDHFTTLYPGFLTPTEFAEQWLGRLIPEAPMAVMTEVQELVVRLINSGTTAPQAVIAAATYLSAGVGPDEFESTFANFANKVEVATLHTVTGRMDGDFAALQAVLAEVTSDEASVQPARDGFPEPMGPDPMTTSQTFTLTTGIDSGPEFTGGDADDTFIAAPVQGADLNSVDTLNADDELDGGGGTDTIRIRGAGDLTIEDALVSNIEIAQIRASGSIDADLSGWDGLQSVEIARIGSADDLEVTVDGAMVKVGDTLGGDVTIVRAGGMVDIKAGKDSDVVIGSGEHTESAMVKGGASVTVAKNGAGAQSMTVTKVVVDGVAEGQVTVITPAIPADTSGVTEVRPGSIGDISTSGSPSANNPRYQLWDPDGNANTRTSIQPEDKAAHAAGDKLYWFVATTNAEQIEVTGNALDNYILITDNIENARGYVPGTPVVTEPAGSTVMIHSDAIETVQLHNTKATAVVRDESKTEDGKKGAPESLTVAVDDFDGELHLQGVGASNDVTFNVVKDSGFKLAANAVKTINVEGDGKLELDVNRLPTDKAPMKASDTLETLVLSGAGDFMMDAEGMSKLKSIDASMSSGDNTIESEAALDALETVMGGAGKDKIELVTSATGKLESIQTHGGDDTVKVTGDHRTAGLMVDLGAGDDTFEGDSGGNKNSRIDGGEGRDTLKLSAEPADNGMEGDAKASIFSNFEVLDVGGGTGTFDIALLGVDTVVARGGTNGEVTLSKIADGMGITVHGEKGEATDADIVHDMPEDLRRYSGELDINLLAIGGDEDTKSVTTGEVTLTLAADENIEVLNVDSSATVGGSKRENPSSRNLPGASDYENVLTLKSGESENIEDIYISGDAKLEIKVSTPATDSVLAELDSIDASDNSGGVTFNGALLTGGTPFGPDGSNRLELVGGSGMDMLTGGAGVDEIEGNAGKDILNGGVGNDEITGGAGADTLIGGAGNDQFIIRAASDSQLSFDKDDKAQGMDTIGETGNLFLVGEDTIVLPESLRDSFRGLIKEAGSADVNLVDAEWIIDGGNTDDPDLSPDSVKEFIDENKDGFFETRAAGSGFGGTINQHTVAVVHEANNGTTTGTWLFIDVNNDGDLDLSTDHVIYLVGDIGLTIANFPAEA